jgi:histidinol-phosphate aminotransferase
MTVTELARPAALTQPVYEPGKPIEDVARELGLDPECILKLASNENPLGPSPRAMDAVRAALATAQLYPDGGCVALRDKLARRHGLPAGHIIVGNGSNEILELLGHAFLGDGADAVMGAPAFVVYKLVTLLFGAKPLEVPLVAHTHDLNALARAVTPATRLVFLPSPNNPTGTANSAVEIESFVRGLPEHCIFVFDEAYAEFLENPPDLTPLIREGRKVVCLRTFSKIYGLAGLRIGYGYCHPEIISVLQRVRQPFNVNALAQAAAIAALEDEAFVAQSRETNRAGLAQLAEGCAKLGIETVPSHGNFLMARVGDGVAAFQAMQRNGVIVRPLRPYGMPEWVRVTVGTAAQNERVLAELALITARGAA